MNFKNTSPVSVCMGTVTIVMPVKNEEVGLRKLASEFEESPLSKNSKISILIVLDSSSSDKSREVSEILTSSVIQQTDDLGKGKALKSGIESWSEHPTDFLIMMDADGSYRWEDVDRVINALRLGANVVTGVRLKGFFKKVEGMSLLHHVGNHALALIASIRNRKRILDLCSGLWGFEKETLLLISPSSDGFDFEAELHGRIKSLGIPLKQMPINWRQRVGGEAKIRPFYDGFRILWRIIRT